MEANNKSQLKVSFEMKATQALWKPFEVEKGFGQLTPQETKAEVGYVSFIRDPKTDRWFK